MKRLFLYTAALLTTFATFSCSEDEANPSAQAERDMRPMFRTEHTVPAGTNDPYLCKVVNRNNIQLYWSRITGCIGYEIKMANNQSVAGSAENWNDPTYVVLDTVIYGENSDQLLVEDLRFSQNYRFAIRALSAKGAAYHSKWWGYGDLRHYPDMLSLTTEDKYKVPAIITQKSNITKTGFTLHLDRSYAKSGTSPNERKYTASELEEFDEYYLSTTDQYGKKVWQVSYLVIEPATSNADAKIPEQFKKYPLTNEMFDEDGQATIDVAGLDSNSVYNMYVYDENIEKIGNKQGKKGLVYAQYNLDISVRTKGDPGAPIIIAPKLQDTIHYVLDGAETAISLPIPATPIQPLLEEFMKSNAYAENQAFYLEGGQDYYVTAGLEVFKGFKLATNPEDIAAGKGRARLLLYHADVLRHQKPSPAFFMLGRRQIGRAHV